MDLLLGISTAFVIPITLGRAHAFFVGTVFIATIAGLVLAQVYKPAEA